MQSVVVTGASTGIGRGCAAILVQNGFRVFGSVRSRPDADRVAGELGDRFVPLIFDITDETAVRNGAALVAEALHGEPLFGLVNNAGIAVPGPLLYLDIDEFRHQLNVNVTGQLIVTQAFAPLLKSRGAEKAGRIAMISSVGGRTASPFIGAYNASKFALEGMSECLRRELMPWDIDVIVIAPGTIATPIWDKAGQTDITRYADTFYARTLAGVRDYMLANGHKGLKPEQVGRIVWQALTTAKPKTRYVITPDPLQNLLANIMPKRMLDRQIAARLGWSRPRTARS